MLESGAASALGVGGPRGDETLRRLVRSLVRVRGRLRVRLSVRVRVTVRVRLRVRVRVPNPNPHPHPHPNPEPNPNPTPHGPRVGRVRTDTGALRGAV